MDSITELMQLCRLCLVNDEVNIPIFEEQGEVRQIFLKISACLPVKVSKEDNLPKNICDGCSCKLEMLHQFRSTSLTSEKKLVKWLDQIAADKHSDKRESATANSLPTQHSNTSSNPVVLKQEVIEADSQSTGDDLVPDDLHVSNDAQDYLIQQQQLPYQSVEFQFQQEDGFETVAAEDEASNVEIESEPKQRKRRAAAVKALATMESEDEDDPDLINPKIAKTEEQSDDSGEDPEPTTFVGIPTADDEQPGPSGVGKSGTEAPFLENKVDHQCNNCGKIFSTRKNWRRHVLRHNGEKPFPCDICQKQFTTRSSVKNHKIAVHENENRPDIECDMCGFKSKSKYSLQAHKDRHLQNFKAVCSICQRGFFSVAEMNKHVLKDHEKLLYTCSVCWKSFRDSHYLKMHLQKHDKNYVLDKKYKCDECGKVYNIERSFKAHIRCHIGDNNVYVCDLCGKSMSTKTSLDDHIALHKGLKPFKCDQCGKAFAKSGTLRVHARSHKGIKPYKCQTCLKSFSQRSSFVIHTRYHTGEKPYSCNLCDGTFVSRSHLNVHKKTKHHIL